MLKAIILDFDGVILESVDIKTRAFKELFKDYPEHLDRIAKLHLDNAGMSRFDKFKIIYSDYLARPIEEGELKKLGEAFSRFVYMEILDCPFVPGAYEFLEKRSKEYQMFVASGTPQDEIRDIVNQRELDNFFHGIYGSPRTKGEILQGILMENQLRPLEVVFIGDAMSDFRGAREAHVQFIGRVPRNQSNPFAGLGLIAMFENLYQLDQQWSFVLERLSRQ
jgi:HAD superfamily hydrolase (TIGR01549 family)